MKKLLMIVAILAAGVASAQELVKLDYPKTLDEVLEKFRGREVYVDVLAVWCKPCLDELSFAHLTDDFFAENDIVKLYLAIDNAETIETCYETAAKLGAKGYFVSYNNLDGERSKEWMAAVEQFFVDRDAEGKIVGVAVPRYAIIDREGKIVQLNAERPRNAEALKEQLKKYL